MAQNNKQIRLKMASLNERIREHPDKIEQQMSRSAPDMAVVKHWQKEI
jgi:hypothetical protein